MHESFEISDFKINPNGQAQQYITCPRCSAHRKKTKAPCLSINIQDGVYSCHHCGLSGKVNTTGVKQYKKEAIMTQPLRIENITKLPRAAVDWFMSRGITQPTIKRNHIFYTTKPFMVDGGYKELPCMGFPCKDGDDIMSVQYRPRDKMFSHEKGGTPIFFGVNDVRLTDEVIITEGYIDKMSYDEVGFTQSISVPNGTTITNREREIFERTGKLEIESRINLPYLDSHVDLFENKKRIYLATDNDAPGVKLREELARRLGRDRCYLVEFPHGCKDANDVLVNLGVDALRATIEDAQPYPLSGILTMTDLGGAVDNLYQYGYPKCDTVGYKNFDDLVKFRTQQLYLITGTPGSGKTIFTTQLYVKLAARYGWKFAIFSAENQPYETLIADMCEQYIGKSFHSKQECMSREELNTAKRFISQHFFFIEMNQDSLTLEEIMEKGKELIARYGINAISIDPYTALDSDTPQGMREDQYIKKRLNMVNIYKRRYDVAVFLVAHPRTMHRDKNGNIMIPTLYDISGGSQFFNAIDHGIIINRGEDNKVEVFVKKVKFKWMGKIGSQEFVYDWKCNRYVEADDTERHGIEGIGSDFETSINFEKENYDD